MTTTKSFLKQLDGLLGQLSAEERAEILYDFEEHIRIAMENGKSEASAISALGNPRIIAKEVFAERVVVRANETGTVESMLRAILATLALGFFNLVIVLGPLMVMAGCLIGLLIAALAFVISPFAGIVMLFSGYGWNLGFSMLLLEGVGILMLLGSFSLTRIAGRWFLRYLRFNIRLARGASAR